MWKPRTWTDAGPKLSTATPNSGKNGFLITRSSSRGGGGAGVVDLVPSPKKNLGIVFGCNLRVLIRRSSSINVMFRFVKYIHILKLKLMIVENKTYIFK